MKPFALHVLEDGMVRRALTEAEQGRLVKGALGLSKLLYGKLVSKKRRSKGKSKGKAKATEKSGTKRTGKKKAAATQGAAAAAPAAAAGSSGARKLTAAEELAQIKARVDAGIVSGKKLLKKARKDRNLIGTLHAHLTWLRNLASGEGGYYRITDITKLAQKAAAQLAQ